MKWTEWEKEKKILAILANHQLIMEELGKHIVRIEKEIRKWKRSNTK